MVSSHQDRSIEHTEPMDIDGSEEFQEATQFLAMLKADEDFPPSEEPITEPECSHYHDWSATPSSNRHPQEDFHVDISEFWHQCLGHISASSINRIPTISTAFDTTICESCILVKQHKLP